MLVITILDSEIYSIYLEKEKCLFLARRKGVEGSKKPSVFKSGPEPRHLLVVVKSLPVEMLSNYSGSLDSRSGGWLPVVADAGSRCLSIQPALLLS